MRRRTTFLICLALVVFMSAGTTWGQTLWGYYPINENDFEDHSGNGHHGTPVDGPAIVSDPVRGWVAVFNDQPEKPSRVLCGTDDPSADGQLTVSVWMRWEGMNGNWQGIAGKSFEYGQRRWIFQLRDSDGMIQWGGTDSAGLHIWSDVAPSVNEWLHVAGTCDGEYSKVYINGEIVGEGAGGFEPDSAVGANVTLGFGEDRDDYDESFNGALDEIHILTRALSDDQVQDLIHGVLPSFVTARDPDPPDGAMAVVIPLLQWTAGDGARLHDVYLATDPNLGPDDLVGPRVGMAMYYHLAGLTPGATYYWRIDEIEADGVTIHEGDVWMFVAQPLTAYLPDPADGANEASPDPNAALTWWPGQGAMQHQVYFGSSAADVNEGAADTDQGVLTETTFVPGPLQPLAAYYWRVDEIGPGGSVQTGAVWSFTTFLTVDDFESYTDDIDAGETIYQTWIDGVENGTGSYVGYEVANNGTFGETTVVHTGGQSMPLSYNNVDPPYYSETSRTWVAPQNWTVSGADTLVLYVRGILPGDVDALYVALEDSAGRIGVATLPDATALSGMDWLRWKVPLGPIGDAGVNLTAIRKMIIGIGDRNTPAPGGSGLLFIDDIRLTRPVPVEQ